MHSITAFQRCGILVGILALALLSCSGVANVSGLFATDSPTPTQTLTPGPTLTPSPTFTPTQTPSPYPTPPPSGVLAEEQADGRMLFTDYENHYQFLLPENWKVVFASQEDLQQAIQAEAETDPRFTEMAESFKDLDPDVFRLAAVNMDRIYLDAHSPTLLTVNAYDDAMASSMPMAFVTAMIEDNILKDARSTDWDVTSNREDVEVGTVNGETTFDLGNGSRFDVQQMVIAFQSNKKLILIEIAAPQEYGEAIRASFKGMIDSIKVGID